MLHRVVLLLFSGIWLPALAVSRAPAVPQGPLALPAPDDIPITAEHHYRLSGSARPFLFWISRDNVGSGRMTWRRAADGTLSLELLMGSDPARAPFKTNRWGYIREVVRGDSAELVAVKTDTEEETLEEAQASVHRQDRARALLFIREVVAAAESRAATAIVDVGLDASYRELTVVLDRMSGIREWQERVGPRPQASRPGFLVALTELMQSAADAWRGGPDSMSPYGTRTLVYMHRAKPYELRQSDVELLRHVTFGPRRYARLLRGTFRIRNPSTEYRSQFTVVYGIDGALAAVPVRITYQPRWWLRTQLTLEPPASAVRTPEQPVQQP